RWEQEVHRKLFNKREKQSIYARLNLDMLLRGDTQARTQYYREMFNIAAMSVNDIREKEDMNPVDGGDTRFVNAAVIPLEMASKGEHLTQNTSEEQPEEPERQEAINRLAKAHAATLRDQLQAILRMEHDKVYSLAKGEDFHARVKRFYEQGHGEYIRNRLRPHLEALKASLEVAKWN